MSSPERDDVRVYLPDMALKEKLGPGVTFDQIVPPRVIEAAEATIAEASASIFETVLDDLEKMKKAAARLKEGAKESDILAAVIIPAFAIKSKAGLCGYGFGSQLANSLCVLCELEGIAENGIDAKLLNIMRTQVNGLNAIFTKRMTGDGGELGTSIIAELQRLKDDYQAVISH